ncbi:hypothetical protein P3T76_001306 [Phytophthora citrophthora]|uniref:Uncharacterized protein n=1 Tax=Phytophthora citrophthora TaxID=4793 RepID=A0AAD9H0H2_9STRA|nr:hypothetical protein P3T76_001306 [Phytophthora citrophthora]
MQYSSRTPKKLFTVKARLRIDCLALVWIPAGSLNGKEGYDDFLGEHALTGYYNEIHTGRGIAEQNPADIVDEAASEITNSQEFNDANGVVDHIDDTGEDSAIIADHHDTLQVLQASPYLTLCDRGVCCLQFGMFNGTDLYSVRVILTSFLLARYVHNAGASWSRSTTNE